MALTSTAMQATDSFSLMLSRRCNISCAHCSVESGPRIRGEPTEAEVIALLEQAADAGVTSVLITGGEPMLRENLVHQLIRMAKGRGMGTAMATNGFWGRNRGAAWKKMHALRQSGLTRLTVSYDRYHAEFQGPDPALNIARAAEWFDVPLNINITRQQDDPELAALIAPFEKRHHLKMRFYDVQPVGRAKDLPLAALRAETMGFCNACNIPAVTDDGRVTACNGPSYFVGPDSPLGIGSTRETPLADLFRKHRDDPILETIRVLGPSRLLRDLEQLGGATRFGLKTSHSGMCDLCLDINTNPEAVTALRGLLSAPKYAAERVAARMVITGGQKTGTFSLEHANGPGVVRLWMHAASNPEDPWPRGVDLVLGRSDFDWKKNADYLAACGLTRSVLPAMADSRFTRWAPSFFAERVKASAVIEGMRELTQREALRRINSALGEIGARGVLLKGAAFLAASNAGSSVSTGAASPRYPLRVGGDIDLLVTPQQARRLRAALLACGFTGEQAAARTGPHHLAPVFFRGVPIEIHTRIMPSFWGLPEREMCAHTIGLSEFTSLFTLDAEGMLFHAMMHSTAHLFSRGMRAAWDAASIMEQQRDIDGERLTSWVRQCAMPRGFWVPARVLERAIGVELPRILMTGVPRDDRQRRLERVAEVRLFSAMEGAFDLNPFSKNGFFLMLHDTAVGKARHMVSLFSANERESRRAAATHVSRQNHEGEHAAMTLQLRQGVAQLRAYNRALAARDIGA